VVEAVAGAVAVHFDFQLIMQAAQVTLHCLQPRGNLKFSDLPSLILVKRSTGKFKFNIQNTRF
jgi:hypothetical protein